jgi:hypothetical protein
MYTYYYQSEVVKMTIVNDPLLTKQVKQDVKWTRFKEPRHQWDTQFIHNVI